MKISKTDIKNLVTDERAMEYNATEDKWLYATVIIEDFIELDDYTNLNHNAMDWAVEILEDYLDERHTALVVAPVVRAAKADHEKRAAFDAYCNILLGERLQLELTIDGVNKHSALGIRFTKKVIRELQEAHAAGEVVKAKTVYKWFDKFLETPLPEGIEPNDVNRYCHKLRLECEPTLS